MAIGTTAAIIGAAAIGAGGSILASKSANKAASQANDSQQYAAEQQLQLGRESLALNQSIYNSNYNLLSPWVSRGNVAGEAYSSMLGLPAAPRLTSPLQASAATPTPTTGTSPTAGTPTNSFTPGALPGRAGPGAALREATNYDPDNTAFARLNRLTGTARTPATGTPATGTPTTGTPAATPATRTPAAGQSPQSAMNNFANSAGMQFQLKQGSDAIQNGYAAKGALQSGAAMKSLSNYAQQTALNNYFMPYMSMLGGVSAQGAQAGSAVAGVGTSFGNTAAGINGQMGNAYQGAANSASNAAIAQGYNNANMWNGIAGSIGGALGGLGSSFGGGYAGKFANPAF